MADARFDIPLYTQAEVSRYLDMPEKTLQDWAKGYDRTFPGGRVVHRDPLITRLAPEHKSGPSIPFVGLAEGVFLSGLRRAGMSMQQIRPALEMVRDKLGVVHALASQRLYLAGAQLLWEVSEDDDLQRESRVEARKLIVLKDGQYVFREVVDRYLRRITYEDDYASLVSLPEYEVAQIVAELGINYGRPYFTATGTPLYVVTGRLAAGESIDEVADDFDLPVDQVTEVAERFRRGAA